MADAYSDFAEVYDELMDNAPYGEWCENICRLIERYGISRPAHRGAEERRSHKGAGQSEGLAHREAEEGKGLRSASRAEAGTSGQPEPDSLLACERNLVLDLGCGTGTLTELLSQKGYDMIGVDNSPQMLQIAGEKGRESGSGILYLLQDMRELELYGTVGTVLSVCDSLNYMLNEEDLLRVFRRVNNYLYPGGLFLFDFNTVYKYSQVIGDTVIAENREDCSFIWENYYHEQEEINEYELTVFVREEGERFRRFTENHLQRGYTPEAMCGLVVKAGMQVILLLDADTLGEVTEHSERVYLLAREQGKRPAEAREVV